MIRRFRAVRGTLVLDIASMAILDSPPAAALSARQERT